MQIYSNYDVNIQICLRSERWRAFTVVVSQGRDELRSSHEVINSHDDCLRTLLKEPLRRIILKDVDNTLLSVSVCSHKVNGRISWRINGTLHEHERSGGMQCKRLEADAVPADAATEATSPVHASTSEYHPSIHHPLRRLQTNQRRSWTTCKEKQVEQLIISCSTVQTKRLLAASMALINIECL